MNQRNSYPGKFGRERDKAILCSLEKYRVLDTNQIRLLHFPFMWGQRKAQERMLKLYRQGKVYRQRNDDGFIYCLENKFGRAEHTIQLNYVRLYLENMKWRTPHYWQYEDDYGFIRPDAFCALKNTVTNEFSLYFIELDRSHNPFDKVPKYNRLFKEGAYSGRWWVDVTKIFPTILVVTHRKEKILRCIEDTPLRFEVKGLEELRWPDLKSSCTN